MKSQKLIALALFCILISFPSFGEEEVQATPTEATPSTDNFAIPAEPISAVPAPTGENTESRAVDATRPSGSQSAPLAGDEVLNLDFENPDIYIDTSEAIRSKQYVRRAILSSVIDATSQFSFSRMYFNHLLGFNAIYHRTRFAKYTSGMQGASVGYVTDGGHGFEGGLEISTVSNVFAGYRHFFRPKSISIWPFLGAGGGYEIPVVAFADVPPEARNYDGKKYFGFFSLGVLVPLVDVGLKAEIRGNFYGTDRLILTQGIGVVIFL